MDTPAPAPRDAADALVRIAGYVCDRLSALEHVDPSAYAPDPALVAEVRTMWYVVRREMDIAVGVRNEP